VFFLHGPRGIPVGRADGHTPSFQDPQIGSLVQMGWFSVFFLLSVLLQILLTCGHLLWGVSLLFW
jgi:hypothetical protein